MSVAVWLGSAAALASMVSFVPQAWKIIRTGETKDISRSMYAITVGGFALWTAYGMILAQWPLVTSNIVCFCLSAFILAMKILSPAQARKVSKSIKRSLD